MERACVSSDTIAMGAEESTLNLADVVVATETLTTGTEVIARQLAAASLSAAGYVLYTE